MDREESHLSSNARRSLARAYQAARQKERMAWSYLQNSRATCTAAEREQHLRDWQQAMHAMRELQLQLTASIVSSVTEGLRECAQAALAVQLRRVPQVNDRMRANDGTIWRIDSIAQDQVEDGFFLVQIQKETASGEPLDSIEIYSEDWSVYCLAYGLQLEPADEPRDEASPATR